jgi:hypothetical protein
MPPTTRDLAALDGNVGHLATRTVRTNETKFATLMLFLRFYGWKTYGVPLRPEEIHIPLDTIQFNRDLGDLYK